MSKYEDGRENGTKLGNNYPKQSPDRKKSLEN